MLQWAQFTHREILNYSKEGVFYLYSMSLHGIKSENKLKSYSKFRLAVRLIKNCTETLWTILLWNWKQYKKLKKKNI